MLNVLIADDSSTMQMFMEKQLTGLGYNVVGYAYNGCEAVIKYHELKPDVITMDIHMPMMDGIDAVRVLKKSFDDVKVIMTTSQGGRKVMREALAAGACSYIMKPPTREAIEAAMENIFPGHRQACGQEECDGSADEDVVSLDDISAASSEPIEDIGI